MNVMRIGMAKAHQTLNRTDTTPFLSDVYTYGPRARKRLADAAINTLRALLPQNAPDTTQPANDGYDTDTCRKAERTGNGTLSSGKKTLSVPKTHMNFFRLRQWASRAALDDLRGRSMVEMLGVLAIIGVLSVGAISGYTKAMLKFKLNKQAAQLTSLLNAGIQLSGQFENASNSSFSVVPFYRTLNNIPAEMLSTNQEVLYDIFRTNIQIIYTPGAIPVTAMYVYLNIVDRNSFEICRNIYNIAKPFSGHLYYFVALSNYGTDHAVGTTYWGDQYCTPANNNCIRLLTEENINSLCAAHMTQSNTHIKFVWKG